MTDKGVKTIGHKLRKWIVRLFLLLILVTVLPVLVLRWLPPPGTSFIVQARLGLLNDRPACDRIWRQWQPLHRISPHVIMAVIASEDQLFAEHWGFDFDAIGQVLEGGEKRGASTISQQVSKNLFLWPGRSWVRKGLEAYITVWIELLWDKERIVEVYLNIAQFGPCTFGVEAAARRYYGRSAQRISRSQAALLATVLPNPYRMNPVRPSDYMSERAQWIETQIEQLGGRLYLEQL